MKERHLRIQREAKEFKRKSKGFKLSSKKPVGFFQVVYNYFLPKTFKGDKDFASRAINIAFDTSEIIYKACAVVGLVYLVSLMF